MPSDYPRDLLPPLRSPLPPYIRTLALTGGFFTTLALLLVAVRLLPAPLFS
jgi:hypothetical protein